MISLMKNSELIKLLNEELAIEITDKKSYQEIHAELASYLNHLIKNDFEKNPLSHVFDLRSQIIPKQPSINRDFYKPVPYYQVFGSGFAENLSLIDLLFCEGPRATSLLIASQKADLNK